MVRHPLARLLAVVVFQYLWAMPGAAVVHADESYPNRPVHVLVPFAAGGGTDLITRALTDIVAAEWKTPVVIENRPGGGTTVATLSALAAPPDGYTLLAFSNSFLIAPLITPSTPYRPERDFVGVSLFAVSPHILVVNPRVPARTLAEFAAWAKAQNGAATYASFGSGSSNHLGFEVLKQKLGLTMTHVPYKGSAAALNDLIAGHVDAMLGDLQGVAEQIKAGNLRPLAVANERRLASMPDLPTIAESGVPGFTSKSIFGVVVRRGTPPEIVDRWSAAFADALRTDAVKARLDPLGLELIGLTPSETQAFLEKEAKASVDAVRSAGAAAE